MTTAMHATTTGTTQRGEGAVRLATVLLTVEDTARALSLGRSKVYELLDAGQLRSVKIGRARRVPLEAVHEFVRGLEVLGGLDGGA